MAFINLVGAKAAWAWVAVRVYLLGKIKGPLADAKNLIGALGTNQVLRALPGFESVRALCIQSKCFW